MFLGEGLQQARIAARLSEEALAALAGVSVEALRDAEAGGFGAETGATIDRCACVLGLRRVDLMGEVHTAAPTPLPLLFRDSLAPDADFLGELPHDALAVLGRFQQTVRDIAELESRLNRPAARLPEVDGKTDFYGGRRGEELALRARLALNLGNGPVPSVRRLLRVLGVVVVAARLDRGIDGSGAAGTSFGIDGASTSLPRPAILVNVAGASPARFRTTLVHELCHLLFDYRERSALFSPRAREGRDGKVTKDPALFGDLEATARAFAACFLAPTAAVHALVGDEPPTTRDAVILVAQTFGVSEIVAVNRIVQTYKLTADARATLLTGLRLGPDGDAQVTARRHAEAFPDDAVPPPSEPADVVLELTRDALQTGVLRPGGARRILGLPLEAALPFPGYPAITRSPLEKIRRAAQDFLRTELPDEPLLDAGDVTATPTGFDVTVYRGGVGCQNPEPCGFVRISQAGAPVSVRIEA